MMQVIPKWDVTLERGDGERIEFSVCDHFYSNVLRKVADLDFGRDVTRVEIVPHIFQNQAVTSVSTITPEQFGQAFEAAGNDGR
jgi:hypothetical protein